MRHLLTGRRAAYVGGIAAATAAGAAGAIVLASRARHRRRPPRQLAAPRDSRRGRRPGRRHDAVTVAGPWAILGVATPPGWTRGQ